MVSRTYVVRLALVAATTSACGRLGFGGGDDASADAGPGGPVTVTTRSYVSDSGVLAGVTVWSSRADGTVDDVAISDAAGQVSLRVETGGAVSAAYPGPPHRLHTVLDVAPGDALVFGADAHGCDATPRGTVTVTWPAVPGATEYRWGSGCNQVQVVAPATSEPWMVTGDVPDPFDLVVRAYASGTTIRTATMLAAPTGDGATIAIGAGDWVTPQSARIGFSGFPARFTTGDLVVVYRTPASASSAGADGTFVAPVVDGALAVDGLIPAGLDHLYAAASVVDTNLAIQLNVGRRVAPPFGANLVAPIAAAPTLVDTTGYDPGTRRITWTTVADGPADAVYGAYAARDDALTLLLLWTVWAPARSGGSELTLPAPPPGVTAVVPASGTQIGVYHVLLDGSAWTTLRQREEWRTPFGGEDEDYASSYATTELGPVE